MHKRTHLFGHVPGSGTEAFLVVKDDGLGDVDAIGHAGDDKADQGRQEPALAAVEQDVDAAPKVLAAAQGLDAVCVGDAVVHPVGGGELVVPDALVVDDRRLGLGKGRVEAVDVVGQGVGKTQAEGAGAAVVARAGGAGVAERSRQVGMSRRAKGVARAIVALEERRPFIGTFFGPGAATTARVGRRQGRTQARTGRVVGERIGHGTEDATIRRDGIKGGEAIEQNA